MKISQFAYPVSVLRYCHFIQIHVHAWQCTMRDYIAGKAVVGARMRTKKVGKYVSRLECMCMY